MIMRTLLVLLVLQIPAALFAGGSIAAGEPWRAVLSQQVQVEYKCDLDRFVTEREMKIGDRVSLEGRIACKDGREIDFARAAEHLAFTLRLCQPTVC